MSDLISRQDAIDAVHYYIESGYKCDIFQELKNLPSAEPERKKGEWINHENYDECSRCHCFTSVGFNYCPRCGADMRDKYADA